MSEDGKLPLGLFAEDGRLAEEKLKTRCDYILEYFNGVQLGFSAGIHIRIDERSHECAAFLLHNGENGLDDLHS